MCVQIDDSVPGGLAGWLWGFVAKPSRGEEALLEARIVGLDNRKPGAALLIESAAKRIAQITGATWVGNRSKGTAATPVEDDLLAEIVNDADYVITGTAD